MLWRFLGGMRHKRATRPPDADLARLATRQHGIVSVTQLRALGLSPDAIKRRSQSGRLHRIHRGVYAVGHSGLSDEGRWLAAVLACGEGAVLSCNSAAELWKLLPARGGPVDVTVPGQSGRKKRFGVRVHRSSSMQKTASTVRKGIPVTTPARTIADLRRTASPSVLRRAVREAGMLGLPIADDAKRDHTRSELERLFLRLCRRHRLPSPQVNVKLGRYTADFLWADRRLVVETDGWQAHRSRLAFEEDHARDLELKLRGYEVLRFTYRQVRGDPGGVAAALRALLS